MSRSSKTPLQQIEDYATPIPFCGCLIWQNGLTRTGYGKLTYRYKTMIAHRAVWQEVKGDIPYGLIVCHKCDVRSCVNIDHLFLGTHQENADDMVSKGRQKMGERHWNSKLTSDVVSEIKSSDEGCRKLSKRLGISKTTVQRIRNGKSRIHG